jgi:hypothetical protein
MGADGVPVPPPDLPAGELAVIAFFYRRASSGVQTSAEGEQHATAHIYEMHV